MAEFLAAAALFVLASVALGLVRLLRGPSAADRMMAAQLLGTGGAAICLLLAATQGIDAIADVALTLALLAALAAAALSLVPRRAGPEGER
ncbi:multiple resistance and pH regulation protein F [Starkeya sp. ORNL1]|uniref:monovalent cation/H+ antiporter complex subunit F n=1 Tax=Starkeya sp. ORNL1 TaxID=2709380 RepID=UPI00146328C1|nr:monovalent cation/H+ antiporter complex subunit F [Starkeya sp. ORNL1]QJP14068.1 multiple resistance and pH regulation protein F [Starkeya sp. ORNL1]